MWILFLILIVICFIVVLFTPQREVESDRAYNQRAGMKVFIIICGLLSFALIVLLILISQ